MLVKSIGQIVNLCICSAGPGIFARTVAARQLAWCVQRLSYKQIEKLIGDILPGVLAAVEDASPPVQCMGLRAMHHLATGGIALIF